MNGMWIEMGSNVMLRVAEITAAATQDNVLRVRMRGAANFDEYVHESHEAARECYEYIREHAFGFSPRFVQPTQMPNPEPTEDSSP